MEFGRCELVETMYVRRQCMLLSIERPPVVADSLHPHPRNKSRTRTRTLAMALEVRMKAPGAQIERSRMTFVEQKI